MYKQLKKMRQEEGFTLIELLIVIVILGVLAAIVVFGVAGITDTGKKSACQADFKNSEIAIEAYYAQKGTFPSAIDDAGHSATTLVGAKLLKESPPLGASVPAGSSYAMNYAAVAGPPAGYTLAAVGSCTNSITS